MEDIYLLGVDVGTSSIKVMVIDQNAGFVAQESAVYRLINPDQVSIQIDTADMWNAFTGCIGALISRHKVDPARIKAIGISSLCPGLAAFDEKGTVLVDPIIYSDRRSTEEAEISARPSAPKSCLPSPPTAPWQAPCPAPPCCGSSGICPKYTPKPAISAI